MKKVFLILGIIGIIATASAQYYGTGTHYMQVHDIIMSGFEKFTIAFEIALVVCIIIMLRTLKSIDNNIKLQTAGEKSELSQPRSLTYMVAIGEIEKANKEGLKRLVDALYPLYNDASLSQKVEAMDKLIQSNLPRMEKLGLILPDYVHSGKNFIDYMNRLTGKSMAY